MIYLDTHVVVWMYAGELDRIPATVADLVEANELLISPAVLLELQFLKEIKRISTDPMLILQTLEETIGLRMCTLDFSKVVIGALSQSWTRNPFDRIIAAHALIRNAPLLTKDRSILSNCPVASW